ncbi:MAG: hypothetical protein R2838_02115 [Caldilineaceae bacterium]
MESIVASEPAGALRPEYAEYGQLLQAMLQPHLAARCSSPAAQDQALRAGSVTHAQVYSMRLAGLDDAAAAVSVGARGAPRRRRPSNWFAATPHRWRLLIATTVDELFQGDISALDRRHPVFDDIRAVLDVQFDRLPRREQELLTGWRWHVNPCPPAIWARCCCIRSPRPGCWKRCAASSAAR